MKRILSIFAFCLLISALKLQAQFNFLDVAFVNQPIPVSANPWSWSPTNNPDGIYPLAWYVSQDFYTNTYVYLPDRTTNAYALTNQDVSNKWPKWSGNQNGYPPLFFDGIISTKTNYLRNMSFTSSQPAEVVMVLKYVTIGTAEREVLAGGGGSGPLIFITSGGKGNIFGASTLATPDNVETNNFRMFEYILRGNSSEFKTNTVSQASGAAGSQVFPNLTIGCRATDQFPGSFYLLEAIFYGAGNKAVSSAQIPGTNTTWSSNIFAYLTNKYSL